ncbi:unnamed protein product [Symbiodinium sp. CCMP2456]|nr:unnamed protein product [Symbiodinium sp. CCMP2456]
MEQLGAAWPTFGLIGSKKACAPRAELILKLGLRDASQSSRQEAATAISIQARIASLQHSLTIWFNHFVSGQLGRDPWLVPPPDDLRAALDAERTSEASDADSSCSDDFNLGGEVALENGNGSFLMAWANEQCRVSKMFVSITRVAAATADKEAERGHSTNRL